MSRNDLSGARWRKSSYSDGQANCVEVMAAGAGSCPRQQITRRSNADLHAGCVASGSSSA